MKDIRIDLRLREKIRRGDKPSRLRIGRAIADAQRLLGAPHLHAGAGLRKLKGRWYEIRVGLGQRLIFQDRGRVLSFEFMGNHNEVSRFLRGA